MKLSTPSSELIHHSISLSTIIDRHLYSMCLSRGQSHYCFKHWPYSTLSSPSIYGRRYILHWYLFKLHYFFHNNSLSVLTQHPSSSIIRCIAIAVETPSAPRTWPRRKPSVIQDWLEPCNPSLFQFG